MNIQRMVVTLEVSKLSGWLNANARCAEGRKEGIYGAARGRRWATAAHAACTGERARPQIGGRGHGEERT